MSSKRSNKTARVLNLIATPSEATPVESEQTTTPATPAEAQPAPAEPAKEKKHTNTTKQKKSSKAAAVTPAPEEPAQESPSVAPEESPAAEQPQAAPIPTPQPVVPIVQTVREKEQQVSDDIKSGLLQALIDAEPPAQQPEPPAPEEPAAPIAEDIAAPEAEELPFTEPEAIAVTEPEAIPAPAAPQPVVSETIPPAAESPTTVPAAIKMPQPEAPAEQIYTPAGEQDVEYTNVLQELVEETAIYYTTNMLQCHCRRCITDMKALALTNLPSKYVVLEKSKRAAYMSVYAARYEKELSVQMMRACVIVNEHPHH